MTLLAARAGHPFDLSRLDPPEFLQAMITSFFGDLRDLQAILRRLAQNPGAGR